MMHRYTPSQKSKTLIWTGGRIKDARGQQKSLFNSTLETIMKHGYMGAANFVLLPLDGYVGLYDYDWNLILSIRYEVITNESTT